MPSHFRYAGCYMLAGLVGLAVAVVAKLFGAW